jgi:predicted cytidylate kinase
MSNEVIANRSITSLLNYIKKSSTPMLITISGQSGSGKSTAARMLSEATGIPTVDVGTLFRAMAARRGMDVIAFGRYAERHPKIDLELDAAMLRRARRGKLLLWQGRLAGWLAFKENLPAIKIWIKASARVRARRVAGREGGPMSRVLGEIKRRDRDNRARYLRLYGLDVTDLSVYDAVIPTDNRSPKQVVSALISSIVRLWPKNKLQLLPPKLRKPSKRPPRR